MKLYLDILNLLEKNKEYSTSAILTLCKESNIEISRGRLLKVLKNIELHSPFEDHGYFHGKIILFDCRHPTFLWIKKTKKEEKL